MSLTVAELNARLVADTSQFTKAMNDADGKAGRFGGTMGKLGVAIGGALSVGAIVSFGKASIAAFEESEKVAAQTAAAIKSTGGAAQVTAGHVGDLANSLSMMSGVDDEVIQKGENMLLTFTNIQNKVGKGNDIFDQATKTALDMSVALGQDSAQSAMQLGKALNDPIKGVTALRRVGVQFTDAQEAQIKKMVEAGDVMGAQKMILGELSKEFGGSAEAAGKTFAGQMDRLKVVFGNFEEQVGAKVLPVLVKLGEVFLDDVVPAIEQAVVWFRDNLGPVVRQVADWFEQTLLPPLKQVANFVQANLAPVLIGLGAAVLTLVLPPFIAWAAASIAAVAPIVAVMVAVAALVGGIIYAYNHFETFRDVIDKVAQFLLNTVWPAIKQFAEYIIQEFSDLVGWVQKNWDSIQEAITHVVNVVSEIISVTLGVIQAVWHAVGDDILHYAQAIWEAIRGVVEGAINIVRGIIETVMALINGDWGKAWDGIKTILSGVWDVIKALVQGAIDGVQAILGAAMSLISAAWSAAWDGIKSLASTIWDGIKGVVSGAIDAVVGWFAALPGRLVGAAGDIFGFLRNLMTAAKDWVGGRLGDVAGFFAGLPGRLAGAFGDGFRFLRDQAGGAAHWIWEKVNDIVGFFLSIPGRIANVGRDILSKLIPDIPGSGIISSVISHIPGHAAGGQYGPGPMIVGERGPELLVPSGSGTIVPNSMLGSGGGSSISIGDIVVYAQDGNDAGQQIVDKILAFERRNGNGWRN
jgi:phage-related protein